MVLFLHLHLLSCADGTDDSDDHAEQVQAMCHRWTSDRELRAEGAWSGDAESCSAGNLAEPALSNTLVQLNLYRALARLSPVTEDATRSAAAQECALMMDANGALSHAPPSEWSCYTVAGAQSASVSNLSSSPAVASIQQYMVDAGNETTLGHRRWILSNALGPIGIGSTQGASCLSVVGGSGTDSAAVTPWPSPGLMPFEALAMLDATGWSIQSDSIDLSAAEVTLAANGVIQPVVVSQLEGGYGSTWAISILPSGWAAEPDTLYTVSVTGVAEPFFHDVESVDCQGS